MKILFVIDSLNYGGKERRFVQFIKNISNKNEIKIKIVLLDSIIHYKEILEYSVDLVILYRRLKKDPRVISQLFHICRKWKPNIIHAWGAVPSIYAIPIAKIMKIKIINAMISNAPNKLGVKQFIRSKLTFPFSDLIQSNSKAGLISYRVKNKGNVIYSGFDFKRLKNLIPKEILIREFNIKTKYIVGMVASFRDQKDYLSFISASEILLSMRKDITFICVGDGPNLSKVKKRIKYPDYMIFAGKRNDVESIINIFDIGVLITNLDKHGEGISNTIMEYMALEKPVIATEGGGTNEIVVDGKTGFLIPHKQPEVISEKVIYLLNNPEVLVEMGKESKQRIMESFTIDEMVRKHIIEYEKLL